MDTGERTEALRRLGADPGLCGGCAHANLTVTKRDTAYLRCLRAESDPRFLRYPRLPVGRCPGFEQWAPAEA